MKRLLKLPLRFKILIIMLFVVTLVVSLITFTMSRMFHSDKTTYIHDLTSIMAVNASQEANTILEGYRNRLQVFTRLIYDREMKQDLKSKYLRQHFEDFREFVGITVYEEGLDPVSVFDMNSLQNAGLTKDDFVSFRREKPLPLAQVQDGSVYIENTTITDSLPAMTMAIPHRYSKLEKPAVVSAIIRLDDLLGLAKRSGVFETFIVDSSGTILAHADEARVKNRVKADWIEKINVAQLDKSAGTSVEYEIAGEWMMGGYSKIAAGDVLIGVQIPKRAAYLTARELLNNLLIVSLLLLIISAVLGLFWSRRITRPIEKLSDASKEIGKGHYDVNVQINTRDEIGGLAESFNTMATEIDSRERALKDAQAALVQSEKMAAFGQLGAGIAHEVKNPLAGILGFAQLSLRKLDKENPLYENISVIEKETKRCRDIIDNLMKFARQEQVTHALTDINSVVEDAVTILNHQLGIHQVQLDKELSPDLPKVLINSNQIQQVLMNLIINAQQAFEGEPGHVVVRTGIGKDGNVEISVNDNGPGIPDEIRSKIFEPFFTTKPTGKGTGLGLSVSYGIVKDHNGDIRIESEIGKGTTFVMSFPVGEALKV
ncbi:MAG: HAMP domain-containing protein [Nitrospirota bacterium]|nr:MAG: HAMP domain-containing protein [Nitrospirota bacterium]